MPQWIWSCSSVSIRPRGCVLESYVPTFQTTTKIPRRYITLDLSAKMFICKVSVQRFSKIRSINLIHAVSHHYHAAVLICIHVFLRVLISRRETMPRDPNIVFVYSVVVTSEFSVATKHKVHIMLRKKNFFNYLGNVGFVIFWSHPVRETRWHSLSLTIWLTGESRDFWISFTHLFSTLLKIFLLNWKRCGTSLSHCVFILQPSKLSRFPKGANMQYKPAVI